jgi:hypothetical protein
MHDQHGRLGETWDGLFLMEDKSKPKFDVRLTQRPRNPDEHWPEDIWTAEARMVVRGQQMIDRGAMLTFRDKHGAMDMTRHAVQTAARLANQEAYGFLFNRLRAAKLEASDAMMHCKDLAVVDRLRKAVDLIAEAEKEMLKTEVGEVQGSPAFFDIRGGKDKSL